jgi:hypothetical protein
MIESYKARPSQSPWTCSHSTPKSHVVELRACRPVCVIAEFLGLISFETNYMTTKNWLRYAFLLAITIAIVSCKRPSDDLISAKTRAMDSATSPEVRSDPTDVKTKILTETQEGDKHPVDPASSNATRYHNSVSDIPWLILERSFRDETWYGEFMKLFDEHVPPQAPINQTYPEPPSFWLRMADDPKLDSRIRTVAFFGYLCRHVSLPQSLYDLYCVDPNSRYFDSTTAVEVSMGNAFALFPNAVERPYFLLFLRSPLMDSAKACMYLKVVPTGRAYGRLADVLSNQNELAKEFTCEGIAFLFDGIWWTIDPNGDKVGTWPGRAHTKSSASEDLHQAVYVPLFNRPEAGEEASSGGDAESSGPGGSGDESR